MITCLIVDDEPFAVNLLEDYIRQTDFLSLAASFYHALDAAAWLRQNRVDVVFLDIEMPKLSGMGLSSFLPPGQQFVFTTAYAEYAVESYEKNAADYLLKPITYERFLKTALKMQENLREGYGQPQGLPLLTPGLDFIFAKTGRAIVKIIFDDILFVEGQKDYVAIHTAAERHIVYKRIKEMEEILPSAFMRAHLSYIVNMRKIQTIEDKHVCIGGKKIPIGGKYEESFMTAIRSHLM